MNDGLLSSITFALSAYAVGCMNTGYYLVRVFRSRDIREVHSGSTGARNVGRILGRSGFLGTFSGDALKGALVIWTARALDADPRLIPWLAPLVVAGHILPAQLGFRGGKGLSTALGTMLALDIRFALIGLVLYFAPRFHSKGHVLSGIAPMVILPFLPFPAWSVSQVSALCLSSAFVLFAHRKNLVAKDSHQPGAPTKPVPAEAMVLLTPSKRNGILQQPDSQE
ncbi:MAG: glycerol-3-phosphate acyltransferase [Fibrobacterota bacterium]|nr:glycerol-3-phosphate acyltransferase [Fibrobacterota bacterium]